jgi:tetratricopeptide (TPR) repeat protein/4-amino-4-deoxy-L-arabinose transferase-like glycosyltransferase
MQDASKELSFSNGLRELPRQVDKHTLFIGLGIFGLALVVRLLYLWDSSANPFFLKPIVDSASYVDAARKLAAGDGVSSRFLFQPFFYPFFLSVVFWFTNSSIICAKVVQVFVGAVTCVLTFQLGKKVFGRKVGIIAGVITAFYGPMIFFEAELLATGWAAFWSVVLILLFLKCSSEKSVVLCAALGVCTGLSILTRPTFVIFAIVAVLWLAIVFYSAGDGLRRFILKICAIAFGFLLVVIPVGVQNFRLSGRFGFLPYSAGLNLYIGNNPNYARTITTRPGPEWEHIISMPLRSGVSRDPWERQKFFKQKVIEYVINDPFDFANGLLHKAIEFFSSREIPRNIDIYFFRKWSGLLALSTWKVAGFGFPFGVILPLALLGLASYRRQLPVPILLFLIFYPLSIILVFVAGRYRVPIIPIMSVLAGAGLQKLTHLIWARDGRRLTIISFVFIVVMAVASLAGPFPQEKVNYEAEFYLTMAIVDNEQRTENEVFEYLNKALELEPDNYKAHYNLASTFESQNKLDEAIRHYRRALQIKPNYTRARGALALALKSKGQFDEAISHYRQVLVLEPGNARNHVNLGNILSAQGKFDEAIAQHYQALRINPNLAEAHYNLANALKSQGKFDKAIKHYREALAINTDLFEAHLKLGIVLQMQSALSEAEDRYRSALELNPEHATAHNNLASILIMTGQLDEALEHFRTAIRIDPGHVMSLSGMARILAAHPDPKVNDAKEAVELAERAAGLTNYQDIKILYTLMLAYAADGRFEQAAETGQKALTLPAARENKELVGDIHERLRIYRQEKLQGRSLQ